MSKFFKRKDSKPPNKIRFAALHFRRKFDNFEYLYRFLSRRGKKDCNQSHFLSRCMWLESFNFGFHNEAKDFFQVKFLNSYSGHSYIPKISGDIFQTFEFSENTELQKVNVV